jgi:hypothetical protein
MRIEKRVHNFNRKPERVLGLSWHISIKSNLKEIGYEGAEWIHLAQDRVSGGLL